MEERWGRVGERYMPQYMNVSLLRPLISLPLFPFRSVFDFGRHFTRLEITQNKERERERERE